MLGIVIAVSVLVTAGCRSSGGADFEVIDAALTLPSLNDEGNRLAYLSIRDGLVASTVVNSSSSDELWTGPSSYFRGGLGPLARPLVIGNAMYVNTFEEATLEASISRIDLVTGSVMWTADLGPHYGGPFECDTDLVCVHAHPSVAPVSTFRFHQSSGARSEGSAGGTAVYGDTEVMISEAGSHLVATSDGDAVVRWSVDISEAFGAQVSTEGGSWSERFGDKIVIWLGGEDAGAGRSVAFDVDSGSYDAVAEGWPCLIPLDAALDLMCFRTEERLVLAEPTGRTLAATSYELGEDDVVPTYIFDASGHVLLMDGPPLRIGSTGFIKSEPPATGWCPYKPDAVEEPAQGPTVTVPLPRRFFPCDLRSSRPLDAGAARNIALAAAAGPNADLLVAQAGDSIAYFEGPKRLVLSLR